MVLADPYFIKVIIDYINPIVGLSLQRNAPADRKSSHLDITTFHNNVYIITLHVTKRVVYFQTKVNIWALTSSELE